MCFALCSPKCSEANCYTSHGAHGLINSNYPPVGRVCNAKGIRWHAFSRNARSLLRKVVQEHPVVISFRSLAPCLQHSCLFMHTAGSQRGGGPALRRRLARLHGLGLPEPPMERQGPPGLVESSRIRGGHGRGTVAWVGLGPKGG